MINILMAQKYPNEITLKLFHALGQWFFFHLASQAPGGTGVAEAWPVKQLNKHLSGLRYVGACTSMTSLIMSNFKCGIFILISSM